MRINPINTHFNPLNAQFPLYVRTNSGDGMVCDVFVHTYSMYHYVHIVYILALLAHTSPVYSSLMSVARCAIYVRTYALVRTCTVVHLVQSNRLECYCTCLCL